MYQIDLNPKVEDTNSRTLTSLKDLYPHRLTEAITRVCLLVLTAKEALSER